MVKQILVTLGLFALIAAAGLVIAMLGGGPEIKELKIGEAVFRVEVADAAAEWAKGLSGRERLAENEGMLFVFPKPEIQKFWMKDMKFPIDIVWIRDNQVVGMVIGAEPAALEEGEPRPSSDGREPTYEIYTSPEPADKVLEINAGLIPKLGTKTGDKVELLGKIF